MRFEKRKAVSPVIATVILVAVAITVAVGTSYWLGGISAQYTNNEKVEIQSAYSEFTSGATGGWELKFDLKNSGSASSTITHVFINDVEVTLTDPAAAAFADSSPGSVVCSIPATGLNIGVGESKPVSIWIDDDYASLSAGTTVNVKFHSGSGMEYIRLVRLL
ncbi:MAG: archaellin/type IV pilin N-terminal domain-containing protein [Promethearchaeota archaeon]|jgi:flagellin-like protein